jgi:hypothetical protein
MLFHRHPVRWLGFARMASVRLGDVDPALARELRAGLAMAGEDALASAVEELTIVESCLCGDEECASFYPVERFQAAWYWGSSGRTVRLRAGLAVDAAGDRIVAVEVVDRPILRRTLRGGMRVAPVGSTAEHSWGEQVGPGSPG